MPIQTVDVNRREFLKRGGPAVGVAIGVAGCQDSKEESSSPSDVYSAEQIQKYTGTSPTPVRKIGVEKSTLSTYELRVWFTSPPEFQVTVDGQTAVLPIESVSLINGSTGVRSQKKVTYGERSMRLHGHSGKDINHLVVTGEAEVNGFEVSEYVEIVFDSVLTPVEVRRESTID